MLQAHHRIAIPPETRFLLPVYFGREKFGDLSQPENRKLVADKMLGTKQFRDMGLDPDEVTAKVEAEGVTVGAAVGAVLRMYADKFGKVRWGDKRPNYRNYIWVIQRMFPDAQFIHLVRDGRDCVASMAALKDWRDSTYPRLRAWMETIEHGEHAKRELPADTFYELRYEELVTEPKDQLTSLCEYLGEPFDEAMLSPYTVADVIPERKTWHSMTRQEISSSSVGKFAERLEPWQISLCEAVMGERLKKYGYELTGAPEPASDQLAEYRRVDTEKGRQLRRQRRSDDARVDRYPVADPGSAQAAGSAVHVLGSTPRRSRPVRKVLKAVARLRS